MAAFGDRVLGKGVVVAKDTPNFIANHLALHGVAAILRAVDAGRYSIDEVDAITGRAIGRPASATFRTMDIAGLDVLAHVLRNLEERLERPEDRAWFRTPGLLAGRLAAGALGEKAGRGFYERRKDPAGASAIFTFDPASGEYLPQRKPSFPSIEAARSLEDSGARVRTLFAGADRVGQFLRETLAPTLVYAARVAPDIAHSIDDVDRVMRWGFGWDLGPFELIDAIGVREVVDAAARARAPRCRRCSRRACRRPRTALRDGALPPAGPGRELLRSAKASRGVVAANPGASLVDLGDGVLAVEFHSKMNAIGGDTIAMLHQGVREATRNYRGPGRRQRGARTSRPAPTSCSCCSRPRRATGTSSTQMVRAFQQATLALRYSEVPVVVAHGRSGSGRRVRGGAARRPRAGGRRDLHGPGRSGRRADPGRRRHQGDGRPRHGARDLADRRSAARDPAGLRDRGPGQGVGQRARRAAPRLSRRHRRRSP